MTKAGRYKSNLEKFYNALKEATGTFETLAIRIKDLLIAGLSREEITLFLSRISGVDKKKILSETDIIAIDKKKWIKIGEKLKNIKKSKEKIRIPKELGIIIYDKTIPRVSDIEGAVNHCTEKIKSTFTAKIR